MSKKSEQHRRFSSRMFLKSSALLSAIAIMPRSAHAIFTEGTHKYFVKKKTLPLSLKVNGQSRQLDIDTRSTLLDVLRENLDLTGTKKGCDHGQCGACTVHIDGQRSLSCLTLAATLTGKEITTIEGLEKDGELHPMQQAFLDHDGFQCGYCTPGQIMSAVACVNEGHTGSVEEIKEFMSGNLCRCGAYNGITKAIQQVAK
ncbi:MAG: (2Fe-2S)-binding protein [Bacteroidia bacterium]